MAKQNSESTAPLSAAVLTIGDELLIGQIVDTNSAHIASVLDANGIHVSWMATVGDDGGQIRSAVEQALSRASVVIMTGGLGPTKDDITKRVLADMFGCGMRQDEATYAHIERMMTDRGIEFNELNRSQALVPAACEVIANNNGTAPGMWFERDGSVLVSLPGVPFEMRALLEDEVIPRLRKRFATRPITHKTLITTGIAESVLAERIAAWEDALPGELHLAYLPGTSSVRLRLSAYGMERAQAEKIIEERFDRVKELIPANIVGYGGVTVQRAVAELLTARGKTLALAESCTGGEIARRFTAMPGASRYLLAGVVAYDNRIKSGLLGVSEDDLRDYGAVSRQAAEQMAEGARRVTGADFAISTTGVAGPDGGSAQKPVGTVWMAVSSAEGTVSRLRSFGNLREQNIERASTAAIDMLRLLLEEK